MFVLALTAISCESRETITNVVKNSDAVVKREEVLRFKNELERLNDSSRVQVHIPDDARIIYATEEDVLKLENAVVLFGWPKCPWFRNAIEPLLEFSKEKNITLYYLNIHDIRDQKELVDGKVVVKKEGSKGYQAIVDKFKNVLNPYSTLAIDSIKRISSPTVLYIEKGKGAYKVVSTVVSQKDPAKKLDSLQRDELKLRYAKYFLKENIAK